MKRTLGRIVAALVSAGLTAAGLAMFAAPAQANCDNPRRITISDARAYEGSSGGVTMFIFTATSSGSSCGAASVQHAAKPVTATPGDDYAMAPGTLSWDANDSAAKTVTAFVMADIADEPNQSFTVELTGPTGFTQLDDASGTGTILDDDGPLTWNANDASCVEGSDPPPPAGLGFKVCQFTVTTSLSPAVDITAKYVTQNGTAVAGQDYTVVNNGQLKIKAGTSSAQGTVLITTDFDCEAWKTFTVKLSLPSMGTLADADAIITIEDDDFFCPAP